MSTLIFCLWLSVEQGESFNGRNRELQNRSSRKMRSAESAMTSNQTQSFIFDSDRKGWQTFNG